MKTYRLYLESGPKGMKTMVHVLDLLGCVATGPTTDAALEATPDAIRDFLHFAREAGEKVQPNAKFETVVVEHIAEAGRWLGNGSPYATFEPDLQPVTAKEIDRLLARFHAMREALASIAETTPAGQLDAAIGSRSARRILQHVVGVPGGYLSPVVGGSTGFSRVHAAAERGDMPLADALREVDAMAAAVVRSTTPAQRKAVIQREKETRTLCKALRRILEHDWEHLAEIRRAAP